MDFDFELYAAQPERAPIISPTAKLYVAEYLRTASDEQLNRCVRGDYAGAWHAGRERLHRLSKRPDTPTNKPSN